MTFSCVGLTEKLAAKRQSSAPQISVLPDEFRQVFHSEPEDFKKSTTKKLVKSNKSISGKSFFDQLSFFTISKMAKNQFLNWGKV